MAVDLQVEGALKLAELSKLLKQAPKDVAREVSRALGKAAAKAKQEPLARTEEFLPKGGGLAKRVSRSKLKHRVRKGDNPKVTIQAQGSHTTLRDPLRADKGRLAHPVFGMAYSRNPWQLQDIKRGWFTEPLEDSKELFQQDLILAIDDYITKIERKYG